jgi:type IV pilus biogenesis protein CpaD/CtpE
MNTKTALVLVMMGTTLLGGCSRQNTPSMMNTSRIQVVPETQLQQRPVKDVSTGYLQTLADDYARYGAGSMQLSLAYDPAAKNYGSVKAFKDLAKIKAGLAQYGVKNVTADAVKTEGQIDPVLLVSYDSVHAAAPAGCRNMPGFDDGLTDGHIGDYKFGCTTDTMLAKQIYRPSDLQGNAGHDLGDGRRAANSIEYYRTITSEEAEAPIERIEREEIQN